MEIDKEQRLKNLVASYQSGAVWQLDDEMRLFIFKKIDINKFSIFDDSAIYYAGHFLLSLRENDQGFEVRNEDDIQWSIRRILELEKYLIIINLSEALESEDTESYKHLNDDFYIKIAEIMDRFPTDVSSYEGRSLPLDDLRAKVFEVMSKEQYSFFNFSKAFKQRMDDEAKAKVRSTETRQKAEDIHQ